MRVHELAKKRGMKSADLIKILNDPGLASPLSKLPEKIPQRLTPRNVRESILASGIYSPLYKYSHLIQ